MRVEPDVLVLVKLDKSDESFLGIQLDHVDLHRLIVLVDQDQPLVAEVVSDEGVASDLLVYAITPPCNQLSPILYPLGIERMPCLHLEETIEIIHAECLENVTTIDPGLFQLMDPAIWH